MVPIPTAGGTGEASVLIAALMNGRPTIPRGTFIPGVFRKSRKDKEMVYSPTDKREREAFYKDALPASILTDAQLHAELEKGFSDLAAGRTRPAKQAFEDLRQDYREL